MNSNQQLLLDSDVVDYLDDSGWTKRLPAFLRSIGAVAILCSLYSFLMRGWEGGDDLVRYLMLLGHTGLLGIIGLTSGHFLKEGKGARLLFMLALVSVVVNFAVLGAFIYAEVNSANATDYPAYLAWSLNSASATVFSALLTVALLVPITLLGFRILSRGLSWQMSTLYLVSNFALLIPLRDPVLVAAVAAVLGSYTLLFSVNTVRQRTEAKTREGIFALLVQFVPIMTLLVRNMWLYSPELILFASASLLGFVAIRQSTLMVNNQSVYRTVAELISVILALFAGIGFSGALVIGGVNDSLALAIGTLIAAGLCYEISLRAVQNVSLYRVIASCVIAAGLLINLFVYPGIIASLSVLIVGIAMMMIGYSLKQSAMMVGGTLLVIIGLGDQLIHLFAAFDFSYWVGMALLGAVAIVAGSLIEVRGSSIKQALLSYKARYQKWSY